MQRLVPLLLIALRCHGWPDSRPYWASQPHLEDSSVYRAIKPTRLDEIKNLYAAVQAGRVGRGLSPMP